MSEKKPNRTHYQVGPVTACKRKTGPGSKISYTTNPAWVTCRVCLDNMPGPKEGEKR